MAKIIITIIRDVRILHFSVYTEKSLLPFDWILVDKRKQGKAARTATWILLEDPCTKPGKDRCHYSFCPLPILKLIPKVLACNCHKNYLGFPDVAAVPETNIVLKDSSKSIHNGLKT